MEFKHKLENQIVLIEPVGNLIGEQDGIPLIDICNEYFSKDNNKFLVDMKELRHINSSGLGVLITLLTRSRKAGGDVVLANLPANIQNLLLITKLNSIFKIANSLEEGKNMF